MSSKSYLPGLALATRELVAEGSQHHLRRGGLKGRGGPRDHRARRRRPGQGGSIPVGRKGWHRRKYTKSIFSAPTTKPGAPVPASRTASTRSARSRSRDTIFLAVCPGTAQPLHSTIALGARRTAVSSPSSAPSSASHAAGWNGGRSSHRATTQRHSNSSSRPIDHPVRRAPPAIGSAPGRRRCRFAARRAVRARTRLARRPAAPRRDARSRMRCRGARAGRTRGSSRWSRRRSRGARARAWRARRRRCPEAPLGLLPPARPRPSDPRRAPRASSARAFEALLSPSR